MEEIEKILKYFPEWANDICFSISKDRFEKLQAETQQYYFMAEGMIILFVGGKKVTLFKQK